MFPLELFRFELNDDAVVVLLAIFVAVVIVLGAGWAHDNSRGN